MRLLVAAYSLADYPNHNKRFGIYTDASYFQMVACIIQYVWPIACFGRNLNKAQDSHTTMVK